MEKRLNYKLLQNSPDFKNPKPELEQYSTPVDITLEIIKHANSLGHLSGKVVDSPDNEFKVGDEVILTGCRVGEIYFGGYSQFAKVKKEFLVKKPKGFSTKLGCLPKSP